MLLRRVSGKFRSFVLVIGFLMLFVYIKKFEYSSVKKLPPISGYVFANDPAPTWAITNLKKTPHPIDELIEEAEKNFESLLAKRSDNLKTTAAQYRKRRGRHPPPGFDLWYEFARAKKAIIVEDFFDQIYHDLAPFWGVKPSLMREKARAYEMTINIRNHQASAESNWFWTQIWLDLIESIQHLLPDMDIALNAMDEPRIVAPWEEINKYMKMERKARKMPAPEEIITEFSSLKAPNKKERDNIEWETGENG